jgi:DnaJ-class molecular chaperone
MTANNAFDLQAFNAMMEKVNTDFQTRINQVRVSDDLMDAFSFASEEARSRDLEYRHEDLPLATRMQPFGGIDIQKSNAFPMDVTCSICNGTGEGKQSTYCKTCKGTGIIRYEGVVTPKSRSAHFWMGVDHADGGSRTIFITGHSPYPKKFQPSFPKGLVPRPPLCKGLP